MKLFTCAQMWTEGSKFAARNSVCSTTSINHAVHSVMFRCQSSGRILGRTDTDSHPSPKWIHRNIRVAVIVYTKCNTNVWNVVEFRSLNRSTLDAGFTSSHPLCPHQTSVTCIWSKVVVVVHLKSTNHSWGACRSCARAHHIQGPRCFVCHFYKPTRSVFCFLVKNFIFLAILRFFFLFFRQSVYVRVRFLHLSSIFCVVHLLFCLSLALQLILLSCVVFKWTVVKLKTVDSDHSVLTLHSRCICLKVLLSQLLVPINWW